MVRALLNSPWNTEEVWQIITEEVRQIIFQVVGVDGWWNCRYCDGALFASYSVITSYARSCLSIWCPPAHYHPWTNITMTLQLVNQHYPLQMMTLQVEVNICRPMMTLLLPLRAYLWQTNTHSKLTKATWLLVDPNNLRRRHSDAMYAKLKPKIKIREEDYIHDKTKKCPIDHRRYRRTGYGYNRHLQALHKHTWCNWTIEHICKRCT